MQKILSYGGGVNSTAILALAKLKRFPTPHRILFCDTGAERPETYCYIKYISKFFNIEVLKSKLGSLVDYCEERSILPTRQFRWCTDKFKIRPRKAAIFGEHKNIMGISYEEKHRAKDFTAEYPLIEMKIDRDGCIKLIKEAGLDVPIKSGCFICPMQKMKELNDMRRSYPEQFRTLCDMEKRANKKNPNYFFKRYALIGSYCNDKQTDFLDILDPFENYQHCLCKYD